MRHLIHPIDTNNVDRAVEFGEYVLAFQIKQSGTSSAVNDVDGECHWDVLQAKKLWPGKKLIPVALFAKKAPGKDRILQLTDRGVAVLVYGRDKNLHLLNGVSSTLLKKFFGDRLVIA